MTHFLIITNDPDELWDVEHPEDCPTYDLYDGACTDYACKLGLEISNVGLPEGLTHLPPGRYEVEYWEHRQPVDMWGTTDVTHAGIRIVVLDEAQLIMNGIDRDWWRKIILAGRKTGFSWEGDHERP